MRGEGLVMQGIRLGSAPLPEAQAGRPLRWCERRPRARIAPKRGKRTYRQPMRLTCCHALRLRRAKLILTPPPGTDRAWNAERPKEFQGAMEKDRSFSRTCASATPMRPKRVEGIDTLPLCAASSMLPRRGLPGRARGLGGRRLGGS